MSLTAPLDSSLEVFPYGGATDHRWGVVCVCVHVCVLCGVCVHMCAHVCRCNMVCMCVYGVYVCVHVCRYVCMCVGVACVHICVAGVCVFVCVRLSVHVRCVGLWPTAGTTRDTRVSTEWPPCGFRQGR